MEEAPPATVKRVDLPDGFDPDLSGAGPARMGRLRAAVFGSGPIPAAEAVALVACFMLVVAHGRGLFLPGWTVRFGLVLAAAPVGIVLLGRLSRRGDRSAWCAVAFLLSAAMSSVLSPAPWESLKGSWGTDWSLLIFVGAFGYWAISRSLSGRSVALIPRVAGFGLALNVVVGMLQVAFDVTGGSLATISGRASGFLGNPVYYGAVTGGFAALCAATYADRAGRRWLIGAAFFAFGSALSGSRVAAAALFALVLTCVVVQHSARSIMALGSVLAGTVIGAVYIRSFEGPDTLQRLSTGEGGGRFWIWRYALDAAQERPVLGWGLGNHSAATRPHYSLEFTRDYAYNDRFLSWPDPHNAVLHILVTGGIIGVVLAAAFVASQLRCVSDWPLVAMVAVIAATWMLQPMSMSTVPLAMFLFGAAVSPVPRPVERDSVAVGRLAWGAVGVGVFLGAYVIVADLRLTRALGSQDVQSIEAAGAWLAFDPVMTGEVGRAHARAFPSEGADEPNDVLRYYERATVLTPNNALYWAELGRRQLSFHMLDEARQSSDRAIELQPFSPTGWQVRLAWSVLAQDRPTYDEANAMVCALGIDLCDTSFELDQPPVAASAGAQE